MKKLVLTTTILLLTGCFGDVGKGYITKTCTKQEIINENIVTTTISIKSKKGDVEAIEITEEYDENMNLTNILDSKKSEQNLYKKLKGITLEIDKSIFRYNIDVKNTDELIIQKFDIKKDQHNQIKHYETNGFTCKW